MNTPVAHKTAHKRPRKVWTLISTSSCQSSASSAISHNISLLPTSGRGLLWVRHCKVIASLPHSQDAASVDVGWEGVHGLRARYRCVAHLLPAPQHGQCYSCAASSRAASTIYSLCSHPREELLPSPREDGGPTAPASAPHHRHAGPLPDSEPLRSPADPSRPLL